jgi:hypothetical protein
VEEIKELNKKEYKVIFSNASGSFLGWVKHFSEAINSEDVGELLAALRWFEILPKFPPGLLY